MYANEWPTCKFSMEFSLDKTLTLNQILNSLIDEEYLEK